MFFLYFRKWYFLSLRMKNFERELSKLFRKKKEKKKKKKKNTKTTTFKFFIVFWEMELSSHKRRNFPLFKEDTCKAVMAALLSRNSC